MTTNLAQIKEDEFEQADIKGLVEDWNSEEDDDDCFSNDISIINYALNSELDSCSLCVENSDTLNSGVQVNQTSNEFVNSTTSSGPAKLAKQQTCYSCGVSGHIARNCKNNKRLNQKYMKILMESNPHLLKSRLNLLMEVRQDDNVDGDVFKNKSESSFDSGFREPFYEVDAQEIPSAATNAIVDEEHNVRIPIEQPMNEEDVLIIDLEEVNADDVYTDIEIPSMPTADVPPVVPPNEVLAAVTP
ncbi:hypothetical protein QVD17_12609 [Tagetes erecta]|uniref:CCHC-type domain-containing protein n=1 Tax=Tagetes erecta TaxID=13708 RepID=A0AAD8P2U3_TARER|nr:hypothetical protein QVD17_12609 [Tagetes erecta]